MHKTTDHAQVVVNPFVIHGAALLIALLLEGLLPIPFVPATLARILGVVVFLAGVGFALPAARLMRSAHTTFNPNRATTALLTAGRFKVSRNPIYVGMLLNYAGLAIFFGTLWGLLLIPVVILLMNRWGILPEEEYLTRVFGEAYITHKSTIPRWI